MTAYTVVRLNDEGDWQDLQTCQTREAADQLFDDWTDEYPDAVIGIIKEEE